MNQFGRFKKPFKDARAGVTKHQLVDQTIVIVDCRDASRDVRLPLEEIRRRYALGHLIFDSNNGQYAVPENGVVPGWLIRELNQRKEK